MADDLLSRIPTWLKSLYEMETSSAMQHATGSSFATRRPQSIWPAPAVTSMT